jgi:hypothetical protein
MPVACVEADISNGKTVHQKGVAWALAVIIGLFLLVSVILSGRGYFAASSHVAARTLSTFTYFQAQALIGMTSISTSPIVRAWTQNFQWSMGIIRVGFLQKMATWYLRATGGTVDAVLDSQNTASVHLEKRGLTRRSNSATTNAFNIKVRTLKGIERVSFVAGISPTNTFLTSYVWFVVALLFAVIFTLLFLGVVQLLVKRGRMRPDRFEDFRVSWKHVLKGILFRVVRI